jgi:GTP-sensing pleiotropic transcriptional regulator CodY
MSPTSHLLIDEIVLADYAATKAETQLDMTMLSMLNGQARTEAHFRELLADAHFEVLDILIYQEEGREALIVARKSSE